MDHRPHGLIQETRFFAACQSSHTRIEVNVDSDGSISFIQLQPIIDLSAVEVEVEIADPALGVVECEEGLATARRLSPSHRSLVLTTYSVRGFLESDVEHRAAWVVVQPEKVVGSSRDGGGTDDLIIHLMEPGEFVVTASFHPRSPYGQDHALLDPVTATSSIQIIDPPERLSSQQDALLALTAEPLVTKYIELTRLEDELPDTLEQTYTAEIGCAFGRWEWWLEPRWAFSNPLRD